MARLMERKTGGRSAAGDEAPNRQDVQRYLWQHHTFVNFLPFLKCTQLLAAICSTPRFMIRMLVRCCETNPMSYSCIGQHAVACGEIFVWGGFFIIHRVITQLDK